MIPVTVAVPENKIAFFKELVHSLNLKEIEPLPTPGADIPEWQKNLVRERVHKAKEDPASMLDWEKVKDSF